MAPTERTIGQLVTDALDDVRAIIDHEKALAKAEITRAAKAGGIGAGLLAAALSLIGLAAVYLLIAAAEGLVDAGMTRWGAFLVVGGVLLVLGLVLAGVGALMLKRVKGPTRTVAQGKGTVEDVKDALSGSPDPTVPGAARDVDLRTGPVRTATGTTTAGTSTARTATQEPPRQEPRA